MGKLGSPVFKLHFIQCHSTALLLKRQPGITCRVKGAIGHRDPADPDALGSYRNYLAKELEELSAREPLRHRKQGVKKEKKGHILFCSQTEHKVWSEAGKPFLASGNSLGSGLEKEKVRKSPGLSPAALKNKALDTLIYPCNGGSSERCLNFSDFRAIPASRDC